MIKRIILTAVCLMAVSTFEVMAQGYSALWKQVSEARSKDLPKSEIEVLQQIVAKAESEGSYGHLLKAKLRQAAVQTQISPDSADVELERLKTDLTKAEEKGNRVLAAVYQSVLGRIYKDKSTEYRYRYDANDPDRELYKQLSKEYYEKSMEPVEQLAKQSSKGYEPTMVEGADSHLFGGDLLHALGIEAGDWKTLHQWYDTHGNRQAACLSALNLLRDTYAREQKDTDNASYSMRKSKYLQDLDSLINVYQDLKECGELAIERYRFMEDSEDASAEEKMNYINYALQHWGAWPRMNILRNAQNQLTLPSFSVFVGDEIQRPNTPRRVEVRQIVNCQRLTMTVSHVDIKGDSDLNPNREEDYNKLRKLIVNDNTKQTVTRRYVGQPDYKVLQDSMTIEGLPVGVYLVEFTTDKNISPERMLLYVSDLYVMREALPNDRLRLVAVNATTGRPVQGAKIHLSSPYYYKKVSPVTLTTDNKGEVIYEYGDHMHSRIYVSTNKDKSFPTQELNGSFSFYDNRSTNTRYNLLTDRSIYRPGQTVHVAVIAYKIEEHEFSSVIADKELNLQLRNANNEVISEKKVTTDDFGKASTDFVLPLSGLTGQYTINTMGNTVTFSVEEYKRPTFQVDFEEVTVQYEDGDTVTVVGHARSFAGVPVQGARVKCKVTRRQASWWWRQSGESNKTILTDTLVTDDEGRFEVRVPMQLPGGAKVADEGNYWIPRYYSFVVEADATDAAGETHHGETSLPLSNRKTAFSVSIPAKIEAEKPVRVSFSYTNNAGNPIEGMVTYSIKDEGQKVKETKTVAANESLEMKFDNLKSGRYILEATCGEDSLQKEFVVFSLKDKRPAIETHDWFHYTGSTFATDGTPIIVQIGSSDKDQHVVYTLVSGEKVLENGSFDQSNAITTRQFTWKEEYGDGVTFTCAWVREGILYQHYIHMRRPTPNKSLKLSWKTFRDRLTPGQKEEWTLHVDWPDKNSSKYEYASEITDRTASLVAVLFDKSLDDIRGHYWPFGLSIYRNLPSTNWRGIEKSELSLHGEQPYKFLSENSLRFTHFDESIFDFSPRVSIMYESRGGGRPIRLRGAKMKGEMMVEEAMPMLEKAPIGAIEEKVAAKNSSSQSADQDEAESGKTSDQVRENLNETAFFYPSLLTDENGDIQISFTLPESITTWRFIGLATDKDVRYGKIEGEVIAKKDVMIQPNMPRFLRLGDKGQIAARLFNTSEKEVKGNARMELVDPETEKVVFTTSKPFALEAGKSTGLTFDVDASVEKYANLPLLICRVIASGDGFSDGEQHYLPILPNYEQIINTVPFTQHGPGTKTIDLSKLFGKGNALSASLTVEYTNTPAWMMIQTLPSVAKPHDKDALSQAAAFYSNSIANYLLKQIPGIKTTIEQWKREEGNETSLMSSLEKNQELKTLVLEETPWVADARHESGQKMLLGDYFDKNAVNYRLSENIAQLRKLQNGDGSWSWWPKMPGSFYMTVAISKMFTRLNTMIGTQQATEKMLDNAYTFMGREILEEVKHMKELEKKGFKNLRPSETAVDWLYLTTLDKRELSKKVAAAKEYLVDHLAMQTREFTIYGKAVSAVILAHNGYEKKAKEYLQSIREYSVYKEEMGRYFDTRKAQYNWFDYKIPTEVSAIEAISLLQPEDSITVEEMQRWLLQSKRTQSWDTPINAVNAVYAFLNNNMSALDKPVALTALKVDNREVDTSKATAGLGYVKDTQEGKDFKTFTAEKTSKGTSWGAVYAVSLQPVTDIDDTASGLKVTREVIFGNQRLESGSGKLKVGDRIKIRITIEAERDYDFVQVSDKRAACLEPIGQLSGYHWGYYCAPRDNVTHYYFDRMRKGKHIVETEYYVDRTGTYQTGTCTVQCAYSPEYTARTAAQTFTITE